MVEVLVLTEGGERESLLQPQKIAAKETFASFLAYTKFRSGWIQQIQSQVDCIS